MHLKENGDSWTESLANIGEIWFGIRIPKQGPNLFDMIGSMSGMFGGGQPARQSTPRSGTPKPAAKNELEAKPAAAPQAMDLD